MKIVNDSIRSSKEESPSYHRIPLALQAIFLESNQGREVHVPPRNNLANKVFEPVTKVNTDRNKWDRNVVSRRLRESALLKTLLVRKYTAWSGRKSSESRTSNLTSIKSTAGKNKQRIGQNQKDSRRRNKKVKNPLPTLSPQDYLTGLLRSRGYSINQYNAIDIGYNVKPTQLQKASYGSYMIEVVKDTDEERLVQLLKCGLSSNACNDFGESIVHMVCRLGKVSMLQALLQYGCDIHVADVNGRTPLHEVCWSHKPQFQLVDLLLQIDPQLLLVSDVRNTLPLSFAPRQCWSEWLKYLESKKDVYWPRQNQYLDRTLQEPKWHLFNLTPQIVNAAPREDIQSNTLKQNWVPVLPLKLVGLVAKGKVDPKEARLLSLNLDEPSHTNDSDDWFSNCTIDLDDDVDDFTYASDGNDSQNEVEEYLLDPSEGSDLSASSSEGDNKCFNDGCKVILADQSVMQKPKEETESLLDEKEMADLLYCFSNLTKGVKRRNKGGILWMSDRDRSQISTKSTASTCSNSISLSDDSISLDCSDSFVGSERTDGTISDTATVSEQNCTTNQYTITTVQSLPLGNSLEKLLVKLNKPTDIDHCFNECNINSEIVENMHMPDFSDINHTERSLMYFY